MINVLKRLFKIIVAKIYNSNKAECMDDNQSQIKKLMVQINMQRKKNFIVPLVINLNCTAVAYRLAECMFKLNYVTTKIYGADVKSNLLINGTEPEFLSVCSFKLKGDCASAYQNMKTDKKFWSNVLDKNFSHLGVAKFDVYWVLIFVGKQNGEEL